MRNRFTGYEMDPYDYIICGTNSSGAMISHIIPHFYKPNIILKALRANGFKPFGVFRRKGAINWAKQKSRQTAMVSTPEVAVISGDPSGQ